ncbi:hypothetical protein PLESTB_001368300 [Pleodorina starrii]|uniref:Uncharacterized protein n=1 Tax=Pleodorina starrii TaxID=330485 RepID=A0A9W6BVC1_9CHLO|nr:hypothetical protein PLESTM_000416700 [Pleodorina starrii]GLC58505.1 hypothetical protein PLESTB_001368300 [Pleodorina starrii]GLC74158.1 hypothetical protein PLESTF_001468200 [Pleodorina starrii]
MNQHITTCSILDSSLRNCGRVERRAVHPRITVASSPGNVVTSLPDEMWLLVLSWCGLRTSATAAACSTAFKSLHRTVASTPALLARALLEDHGLNGAAANLYGSPAGHPHERHAVHCDTGVATALRTLVVLSAPPGVAAAVAANAAASAAAAATAAVSAVASEEADASDGAGTGIESGSDKAHALRLATAPQGLAPIAWASGGAPAFRQLAGGLLCAAAAAGHVQVAATALALGATAERDRALVAASAAGRRRTVRLLLASGADPNAVEPFGPCALHEAARHGYTDIAELLLDAGARVDGVTAAATTVRQAAMPNHGRPASVLPLGERRPTVAPPPTNRWGLWPILGGGGGGTPRHPPPLRVPVPLAADAQASPTSPVPSFAAAAAAPTPGRKAPDVQAFFSESVSTGSPGTSHVRQKDEQPRTPTATASGCSAAWDSDDDDDDGPAPSRAPGPSTPAARPLPLAPPPLQQRKPQLTLPLHGGQMPLPLMPSLTAAPPLPPAMMLMLQGGFQPRKGPSPLLAACRAGHAATVALLLRRGAKADTDGGAELVAAAHPDVVDELLSAVPGLVVHLGAALLAAASANRLEVVSALLRHGADPVFRGGMVLTEVAFKGHVAVLEVLLKSGGARLRESGALDAALDLARTWGRVEVLQLLATAAKAGP